MSGAEGDESAPARALSRRALNVLQNASGLERGEVVSRALELAASMSERDFLRTPYAGKRTLEEVRAWLARYGRTFRSEEEVRSQRLKLACDALLSATTALEAAAKNPDLLNSAEMQKTFLPRLRAAHARAVGRIVC